MLRKNPLIVKKIHLSGRSVLVIGNKMVEPVGAVPRKLLPRENSHSRHISEEDRHDPHSCKSREVHQKHLW